MVILYAFFRVWHKDGRPGWQVFPAATPRPCPRDVISRSHVGGVLAKDVRQALRLFFEGNYVATGS